MTVAELIEELQALPSTATVEVQIRDVLLRKARDYRIEPGQHVPIECCVYDLGLVSIRLDE